MTIIQPRKLVVIALLAISMTATSSSSTFADNDLLTGALRVDLSQVYNAKDYMVTLLANGTPNAWDFGGYTAAWLGVFLAPYNGQAFSGQFSQVGLLTNNEGIHWFVYAEPGVTCLLGATWLETLGCIGNAGDLVSVAAWHNVELVTYPGDGFWTARVYESDGITSHDVARIASSSTRIYVAQSTSEEAYNNWAWDPFFNAQFYHWHPRYMVPYQGFQDWPSSDGNNSTIYMNRSGFCPNAYGMTPNFSNHEHAWFAGTGGQQCSWLLFPSQHLYTPSLQK